MDRKDFKKGFKKGFGQVKNKDLPKVRAELNKALGTTSRMSLSMYMRGLTEPRLSQALAVEAVFAKYGIKEVWGE